MRTHWYRPGLLAMTVVALGTLATKAQPKATPTPTPPRKAAPATRPLPEWAPKDPSREFLRANQLIRSVSLESLKSPRLSGKAQEAALAGSVRWKIGCYEFLGSLDDRQVQRVLAVGEVRIPLKALTKRQRALFDAVFLRRGDLKVSLYRIGAKKDLSNVEVGFHHNYFDGEPGKVIAFISPWCWVRQRDGSVKEDCLGGTLGCLYGMNYSWAHV
jgi:hypothetical protein